MDCPFCKLTTEKVSEMSDEEAGRIYTDSDSSTWCYPHLVAAIHIRKMTAAMGKGLIMTIMRVSAKDTD